MSDDLSALNEYSGSARLFPLPNLVLFPHAVQPLHIFEPRYRQMTADALAGDRLIALVLLQPGWEADYDNRPAIHGVACLGRIVANQRRQDGCYNILLRGLGRVRIADKLKDGKLYRSARAEIIEEAVSLTPDEERSLRRQLGERVPAWFPVQKQLIEQFHKLLRSQLPLGTLSDILAFALPFEVEFKQTLLEQADVEQRVRRLLDYLDSHVPAAAAAEAERNFPPAFSKN